MKVVNVHDAKSSLSALLARVEQGEEVVIARHGNPIAKLVRFVTPGAGSWRGLEGWQGFRCDPALFAPMGDREMDEEGWP